MREEILLSWCYIFHCGPWIMVEVVGETPVGHEDKGLHVHPRIMHKGESGWNRSDGGVPWEGWVGGWGGSIWRGGLGLG